MRDAISIPRAKILHPLVREEVPQIIGKIEADNNFAIRIAQGLRTWEYQNDLYCQPFDKKDNDGDGKIDEADEKVTKAKGGYSWHNFGLAIDFAILYDKDNNGTWESLSWDILKDYDKDGEKDWQEVVKVFNKSGYRWGGDWKSFKDNPHLEKQFLSLAELRTRYEKKDWYMGMEGYVRI